MKTLRLVLSGYYGAGNLGDEAILQVFLEQLERLIGPANGSIEVFILGVPSARRPRILDRFNDPARRLRVEFFPSEGFWLSYRLIKSCDVLVSGGGGIFQDQTSWSSFWFYLSQLLIAGHCRKKTVLLGQSFGPLSRFNRFFLGRILKGSSLITVRSDSSFDYLRELGIQKNLYRTADLAWLLPAEPVEHQIDRPTIGLVARKMTGLAAANFCQTIRETFVCLNRDSSYDVLLLPFQLKADLEFCRQIADGLRDISGLNVSVWDQELAPGQMLSLIGQLKLLISQRYHGLLLAALARVPAIGLVSDDKVADLARELGQPVFSLAGLSAGDLVRAVRSQIELQSIQPSAFGRLAEENFLHLRRVLRLDFVSILDVPVTTKKLEEILDLCQAIIQGNDPGYILSGNPELLVRLTKEPKLRPAIDRAVLVLPDGVGLVWAARRLGLPLGHRIAGIELAQALCGRAAQNRWRIFLLGGAEKVVRAAAEVLEETYPGLIVAGSQHGYCKKEEEPGVFAKISKTKPDLIFVGLGMPKQEKWLADNLAKSGIPLGLAVGGSFDVWSGSLKRAPKLVRRLGLEWTWRLTRQPWRWRRMLALLEFYRMVRLTTDPTSKK